jgi:hypothetical protein
MLDDKEERIRAEAYRRWEHEGRPEGQQERHWHEAAEAVNGRAMPVDSEGTTQALKVLKPRAAAKPKAEKTAEKPKVEKAGKAGGAAKPAKIAETAAKPAKAATEKAPKAAAKVSTSAAVVAEAPKSMRSKKAAAAE